MEKEFKDPHDRDHTQMPEIRDDTTGELLSEADVAFAYTREGRHVIGKEYPNPIPLAAPIGWRPTPPIWEQIRDMVRREMSQTAQAEGAESFEEADDFDVDNDDMYDPATPYEEVFEPTQPWPPATPEVQAAEEKTVTPPPAKTPDPKQGEGGTQSPPESK